MGDINGSKNKYRERLEAAKEITQLFSMERYAYIGCCGIAVLLLFFCAFRIFTSGAETDMAVIGSLFGSGGLITFSVGRLIFMWNKIVDIILIDPNNKGGGTDGTQ